MIIQNRIIYIFIEFMNSDDGAIIICAARLVALLTLVPFLLMIVFMFIFMFVITGIK